MTSGEADTARWVRAAARNNAELCDLVCRGHGVSGEFGSDAWTSARRTPRFYPDAVTLDPRADTARLLARIDASTGASIKDSFAVTDLAAASFRVLFSAQWICRPAGGGGGGGAGVASGPEAVVWSRVVDAGSLRAWESAWSESDLALGLFAPSLLDAPELVVLGGEIDGAIVAGAVVNRSESVVGVSNFFARTGDPVVAWSGLVVEVTRRFPGTGIVGYESGAALDVARRAGFRAIGPLRIWVKD